MTILALSIAGGGLMTAVVGTTAVRKLALNGAVHTICDLNMTKTFAALAYIDAKQPWVGYTVGRLLDQGVRALGQSAQSQIREIASSSPSKEKLSELGGENPLVVQNVMQGFIEERLSVAYQVAQVIRTADASPEGKIAALNSMSQSPLFQRPSRIRTEGLKEDIELGMFMNLVLDRDSLYTWKRDQIGKNQVHARLESRVPIAAIPGSTAYPKSQNPTGAWAYGSSWQEVRFAELESGLRGYIDGLYRAQIGGGGFFEGSWYERKIHAGALQKAAAALETLGSRKRLPGRGEGSPVSP